MPFCLTENILFLLWWVVILSMKSQHVNFPAMSRESSIIPHTEHLHQAVSSCFWLLLLCYGLSHCSGKASQPKDATCLLVSCCKRLWAHPVAWVVVVGDEPTKRAWVKGANAMRSLLMRWVWFGLFQPWRLTPSFQPWCRVQPSFPEVQSCCQQAEKWFE